MPAVSTTNHRSRSVVARWRCPAMKSMVRPANHSKIGRWAGALVLTLVMCSTAVIAIPALPAEAATHIGGIKSTTMRRGDTLQSSNGACRLAFQGDQNVVVYHGARAIWSLRTIRSGADRLVMQGDGNLVLYKGTRAIWSSRTNGNSGATLRMQNDCNLVIYNKDGRARWASNTARQTTNVAPKITLYKAAAAPHGYWYRVKLTGYPAYSKATLRCHDSVDRGGFYTKTVTVNSQGAATLNLCYSADGPDHWVTQGNRRSNTVKWGPGSQPPPPHPPSGPKTITLQRGGNAPAGYWYSVSLSGFSPGVRVVVNCHDSVDSNFYSQTFTINTSGKAADSTLCYSGDGPDHWVTSPGVESNHVQWGTSAGGTTQPDPPVREPAPCHPRPTVSVAKPRPPATPSPRRPLTNYVGQHVDMAKAGFAIGELYKRGQEAGDLATVYLGTEENATQTVHVGDLLWEERGVWDGLEKQLRETASTALSSAYGIVGRHGASSCVTVPFEPDWISFQPTRPRWTNSLGKFNVKVKGDVWVGAADASGTRPVQLRYKVFLSDVYDYELSGGLNPVDIASDAMWRLWDHGRADEFLVEGHGVNQRSFNYTSNRRDFRDIGLNW